MTEPNTMQFKTEVPKTIEWYEERHSRERKKIGNLRRSHRQLQKAHERSLLANKSLFSRLTAYSETTSHQREEIDYWRERVEENKFGVWSVRLFFLAGTVLGGIITAIILHNLR